MSKSNPPKKKVVIPAAKEPAQETTARRARPSTSIKARQTVPPSEMIYDRSHYILMGVGVGLIVLGFLLMSGGAMPSPDVWEPERIYSFRRTVLAPIVVLAGLIVEIVAIFHRPAQKSDQV